VISDRAANTPYKAKTTKVSSMKIALSSNMRASAFGSSAFTNCGQEAKKKIDSFGLRILIRMPETMT